MGQQTRVEPVMVEFHRFGKSARSIVEGERYIRTTGWDAPAVEVSTDLDEYQFLAHLNSLRYWRGTPPELVEAAREALSTHARRILPPMPEPVPGRLVQLDLVTGAAELWAFPFEASCLDRVPLFARRDRPIVLTRRIRGAFSGQQPDWQPKPRVLFVHAAVAPDLPQLLIDEHEAALREALRPWARGGPGTEPLTVREAFGPNDFRPSEGDALFTHTHVLAHGAPVPDPKVPNYVRWGVRIGPPGSAAVPPEDLVDVMRPLAGLPVVVTLAACDLGNQADPRMPARSFAQELHLAGVPVVLASQLPLTRPGSVTLTRAFYAPLLRGEDVRVALHEARASLYECPQAGHDWLSLVAYVRLPEDYADHLEEVGLRAEFGMLKSARERADILSTRPGAADAEFDEVEGLVRGRIHSLGARRTELDHSKRGRAEECDGLLGSAHKQLAEMLFVRARRGGPEAGRLEEASRAALGESISCYRSAFRSNIHHHWSGVQLLALEAAVSGAFSNPVEWQVVTRAAEIDRDCPPTPADACWGCGSLAEARLLAPIAGLQRQLHDARAALALLVTRAGGEASFLDSTRRQLRRYVNWWTNENGYFPGRGDLAADATALLQTLP